MFSTMGKQNSFQSGRGSPSLSLPPKQSGKKLQDRIWNHTPNFKITLGGPTAFPSICFLENVLKKHHIIFLNISLLSSEVSSYICLYQFCLYFQVFFNILFNLLFAFFSYILIPISSVLSFLILFSNQIMLCSDIEVFFSNRSLLS